MSRTKDSLNYIKYRTICALKPEDLPKIKEEEKEEGKKEKPNPNLELLKQIQKPAIKKYGVFSKKYNVSWTTIYFGTYPQKKEDGVFYDDLIVWRVLDVKDGKLYLISDVILDVKEYNDDPNMEIVTWWNCSLRKWLNGVFYKDAFSDREKEAIVGEVGILSDKELFDSKYSGYGFNDNGKLIEQTYLGGYSDYAKSKGINRYYDKYGDYWIHNDSMVHHKAMVVEGSGKVLKDQVPFGKKSIGVRPVITIDVSRL